jgi:hypothetical protein
LFSPISVHSLGDDESWNSLRADLWGSDNHPLIDSLLTFLRVSGAASCVIEGLYVDRDFSASFSAFYSTLFRPYQKYCRRLHFFQGDVGELRENPDPTKVTELLETNREGYLGYVVLRPLAHAPISNAKLAANLLCPNPTQEVSVRAKRNIHVLGTSLEISGFPLSQQDTRVGACAQATIWMAGRHFHDKHGAPWFSMPDITASALRPTDSAITRSLPAGSDYLTTDNMVRALRAMGRHPVFYAPNVVDDQKEWGFRPTDVIYRYVDSGIPVILGMEVPGSSVGHAVVAIGTERYNQPPSSDLPHKATQSDFLTHFLVNDDQRGAFLRLPLREANVSEEYPFCVARDLVFLIVPLPSKVFMTAEVAETIAWDCMAQVGAQLRTMMEQGFQPPGQSAWNPCPAFYEALANTPLVARTYLTYGWRYKARTLKNTVSDALKQQLLLRDFPRYVWVTEFSLPNESVDHDPCKRKVRAHVVNDATGSRFWESTLVLDIPGVEIFWDFNPSQPGAKPQQSVLYVPDCDGYFPKVRGIDDYAMCAV